MEFETRYRYPGARTQPWRTPEKVTNLVFVPALLCAATDFVIEHVSHNVEFQSVTHGSRTLTVPMMSVLQNGRNS